LTDEEFFGALDLDLDALGRVREAVTARNWSRARAELYAHLRAKFRQARYSTPAELGGHSTTIVTNSTGAVSIQGSESEEANGQSPPANRLADDFAERGRVTFRSTGNVWTFDARYPFDYIDFDPNGREYREPMQLWAMYDMEPLREAYVGTGRSIYLDRAREMIASFYRWYGGGASTSWAADQRANPVSPWENWTVPGRLNELITFLSLLRNTELDPDIVVTAMKIILEDQRLHVSRQATWRDNWRQYMCADGAVTAAVFWEFKEAPGWFRQQVDCVFNGAKDLFPDGSTIDLSSDYTGAWVLSLSRISTVIEAFGAPFRLTVPPELVPAYERTIDWQIAMHKPDGRAVQFNNTGAGQPLWYYLWVADRMFGFFGRPDLRWLATNGSAGSPPVVCSFPLASTTPSYAGMYAMRADWSGDSPYLVVDFGPAGSQSHADYGSFILHAYGADFIEDGGCASYGSEAYEHYSRSWRAHNVIAVDDRGQVLDPQARPPAGKPLTSWITNAAFDYAWGDYPLRFADGSPPEDVVHERAIYFAKPDYWLLVDRVDGSGIHRLRSKLQLAWDVIPRSTDAGVVAKSARGPALEIVPFDRRPSPVVVSGQREPFWEGWSSVRQPFAPAPDPSPALIYEELRPLPAFFETLLYPVASGADIPIDVDRKRTTSRTSRGVLLTVKPHDRDYLDHFVVNYAAGQIVFQAAHITLDGELLHLRETGNRLQRIAFVKMKRIGLSVAGRNNALEFDAPTDGYITLGPAASLRGATIFVDLSTRRDMTMARLTVGNDLPSQTRVPVGREVILN